MNKTAEIQAKAREIIKNIIIDAVINNHNSIAEMQKYFNIDSDLIEEIIKEINAKEDAAQWLTQKTPFF